MGKHCLMFLFLHQFQSHMTFPVVETIQCQIAFSLQPSHCRFCWECYRDHLNGCPTVIAVLSHSLKNSTKEENAPWIDSNNVNTVYVKATLSSYSFPVQHDHKERMNQLQLWQKVQCHCLVYSNPTAQCVGRKALDNNKHLTKNNVPMSLKILLKASLT